MLREGGVFSWTQCIIIIIIIFIYVA